MGDLEVGILVERLASGGLGAGWIAWLTTRRILTSSVVYFFRFSMGLWLVWALVESLSLMHAGDFQRRPLLLLLLRGFGVGSLCGCCKWCLLLLAGWCEGFCGVRVSEALEIVRSLCCSRAISACWVGEVSTPYSISIDVHRFCLIICLRCNSTGFGQLSSFSVVCLIPIVTLCGG